MNEMRRRHMRGAALPLVIATIAIIVVLAAAAYFLIIRPNRQATQIQSTEAAPKQGGPVKVSPPPANVDAMSTNQLLAEARKALNDQRLLAPKGNNAFAYYLKVLDRQPGNQVAQDALRETFPFGANAAEQAINQGDFAEAQREIALLARADPDNYTLTILRAKLGAQRKLLAQQKETQQKQAEQSRSTSQQAAAKKLAQQEAQAQQQREALARQREALKRKAAELEAREKQQKTAQNTTSQPARAAIQPPVLIHQVQPKYPVSAVRNAQEGSVTLTFTVTTDGDVSNVQILSSTPRRVFDHAATSAVERWKFKPALRNGKPVVTTLKRRIQFTLGNSR